MSKIKVIMSFIHYPMAIARYLESAFDRRPDVGLLTVGPYTGARIPWGGWINLPEKYAKAPDVMFSGNPNSRLLARAMPIQHVENLIQREGLEEFYKPDLWVQVDAGFHLIGKPKHGTNVFVATDPHAINYDSQRTMADVFFNMQSAYRRNGDLILPYACCPVWHRACDPGIERSHDATLLGLQYPQRNQWVKTLRAQGVQVQYKLGVVFDEARALYGAAPVGLNWSSLNDLNARVFELLGMKRVAVVNQVPALGAFFQDNKHLLTFADQRGSVAPVLWALNNLDEAMAIAQAGHDEVMSKHTWDHRADQILKLVDYSAYDNHEKVAENVRQYQQT